MASLSVLSVILRKLLVSSNAFFIKSCKLETPYFACPQFLLLNAHICCCYIVCQYYVDTNPAGKYFMSPDFWSIYWKCKTDNPASKRTL
jgi:hypothetical protein